MKHASQLAPLAALLLVPSAAIACPYARAAEGWGACSACGSSLAGYVLSLLLGLAVGVASVSWERRAKG